MSDRRELLEQWNLPYVQRGGVTLVARSDAAACIELIYTNQCRFYGYDAFTVTDKWIQPHLDWSPSWTDAGVPTSSELLLQLGSHPPEVTHYEFVFKAAA